MRIISTVKSTANTRFTIFRMNFNSSLSCRLISSKQRDRLQIWDIEGWLVSHQLVIRVKPGGEYEEEDGPLEKRVVHKIEDNLTKIVPTPFKARTTNAAPKTEI